MKSYDARRDLGQRGERAAEDFLRNQGYLVIAKNYRSPYGEIDLIAFDRQTIVFVEVRTQSGEKFGDPVASVNWRKQKQIARTALYYLMRHGAMQDREARFDVVGIRWGKDGEQFVSHIKEAFELPWS